jgi:hypothetical protein
MKTRTLANAQTRVRCLKNILNAANRCREEVIVDVS